MELDEYHERFTRPAWALIEERYANQPPLVKAELLEALIRHVHYAETSPPDRTLLRRYLATLDVTLNKAVTAAGADASPEKLARFVRLSVKPFHHWLSEQEPATPKQVSLLKELGVDIPEGLSKDEASKRIDDAKARKARGLPPTPQLQKCEVPWCEEMCHEAGWAASREATGHILCAGHVTTFQYERCSECGKTISAKAREYSIKRIFTPLCADDQRKRGIATFPARGPSKSGETQ